MPSLDPLSSICAALKNERVVPDVIPADPEFFLTTLFSVSWGENSVMLGNELQKADTAEVPAVSLTPIGTMEEHATYTLAMLDPDAPSRENPKFGPFRHWIIAGLKPPTPAEVESAAASAAARDMLFESSDPLSTLLSKPAITPYRPPGPGPGTGVHRYVFLLFREPAGGLNVPEDAPERGAALEQRRNWSPMKFAEKYGLTLVGANFFLLRSE